MVFDKDDFPLDNFDNTIFAVKDNSKWHAVWSNQCIEIWFLLHFNYRDTDMDRNQCMSDLNSIFLQQFGCEYKKNMPNICGLLKNFTSIAIRNAKKLYCENNSAGDVSPHEMVPCTTVYELVEELQKYI